MLCQVTGSSPFSIDKFVDHTVTVRAPGLASGRGRRKRRHLHHPSFALARPPAAARTSAEIYAPPKPFNPHQFGILELLSLSLSLSLVSSSSPRPSRGRPRPSSIDLARTQTHTCGHSASAAWTGDRQVCRINNSRVNFQSVP